MQAQSVCGVAALQVIRVQLHCGNMQLEAKEVRSHVTQPIQQSPLETVRCHGPCLNPQVARHGNVFIASHKSEI